MNSGTEIRRVASGIAFVIALAGCTHESPKQTASPQMRAYIDPATGQLLSEPPPGVAQPLSVSRPDDSKIEVLNLPGGMKGVRFHGQRQAMVVATVDADGTVKTDCIEGTAAASDDVSKDGKHETH